MMNQSFSIRVPSRRTTQGCNRQISSDFIRLWISIIALPVLMIVIGLNFIQPKFCPHEPILPWFLIIGALILPFTGLVKWIKKKSDWFPGQKILSLMFEILLFLPLASWIVIGTILICRSWPQVHFRLEAEDLSISREKYCIMGLYFATLGSIISVYVIIGTYLVSGGLNFIRNCKGTSQEVQV